LLYDRTALAISESLTKTRREIYFALGLATRSPLASAATFSQRMQAATDLAPVLNADPIVVAAYVGYPNGDFLLLRRLQDTDNAPPLSAFVLQSIQRTANGERGRFSFYDQNLRLVT